MIFREEILDEIFRDCKTPEDLFGADGIFKQLSKAFIESSLNAEMDFHLNKQRQEIASEDAEISSEKARNRRNGYSQKKITSEFGKTQINIPRDRNGEFVPEILPKGQTRFDGFNDKIISLYARGLTTRDIQSFS
jgi:transposase-like protein